METSFISNLGISEGDLIIFLILLNIILIFFLVHVNMKCNRLKRRFSVFIRGRDGKSLEGLMEEKFSELESIAESG